jgi:4-diphosphocytidyl-2-C-methyl-D-erythritol kinase
LSAGWLIAQAKINLALHVTARRPDGFHNLDTLVMFADYGDRLRVESADDLSIDVSGPFASHAPAGQDNLAMQVAVALQQVCRTSKGARLLLEKNIPAGAGLGGGSADAALALKTLNSLWNAGLSKTGLADIGNRFGADIAMCLEASALRASDTGSRIADWPDAPAMPMVLVWPSRAVATGSVFAALRSSANPPMPDFTFSDHCNPQQVFAYLRQTRNDLTDAAVALEPEIAEVIAALASQADCALSRMSGSGSACFGLFPGLPQAQAAATEISRRHGNWWVRAVTAR